MTENQVTVNKYLLRDIEILGCCPAGASLTSWDKGASLALVGDQSSDAVTIKMSRGVDA